MCMRGGGGRPGDAARRRAVMAEGGRHSVEAGPSLFVSESALWDSDFGLAHPSWSLPSMTPPAATMALTTCSRSISKPDTKEANQPTCGSPKHEACGVCQQTSHGVTESRGRLLFSIGTVNCHCQPLLLTDLQLPKPRSVVKRRHTAGASQARVSAKADHGHLGLSVLGLGHRVRGPWLRVWGVELRVWSLCHMVWGVGADGLGFGVENLRRRGCVLSFGLGGGEEITAQVC